MTVEQVGAWAAVVVAVVVTVGVVGYLVRNWRLPHVEVIERRGGAYQREAMLNQIACDPGLSLDVRLRAAQKLSASGATPKEKRET